MMGAGLAERQAFCMHLQGSQCSVFSSLASVNHCLVFPCGHQPGRLQVCWRPTFIQPLALLGLRMKTEEALGAHPGIFCGLNMCTHILAHTHVPHLKRSILARALTILRELDPVPCVQARSQGLPSVPDDLWGICRMFFGIGTYCFHTE